MSVRTTRNLEKKKIAELARHYKALGYQVYAELHGFDIPGNVEDVRPDIVVRKGDETIIIEVKTRDSAKRDKHLIERLARYAERVPGARFDLVMTNPRPQSKTSVKLKVLREELATIYGGLLTEIEAALGSYNFDLVVILCFRLLEGFLAGLAEENDVHVEFGGSNLQRLAEALANKKIVSRAVEELARELQALRNAMVHGRQALVSSPQATQLCKKVISFLRQNDRNVAWPSDHALDIFLGSHG